MTYSDMLYRLDIPTFYFYEPLLFKIFVSWKFLKIYKAFPLSTITLTIYISRSFTVYNHADNHFCKYIYLFQILHNLK